MNKLSIVVDKTLSAGQKANVAAIVLGQICINNNQIYSTKVVDLDGTSHASITENVVILEGNRNQLQSLINASAHMDGVACVVFSQIGQNLSNNFNQYRSEIIVRHTSEIDVIGVGLFGEFSVVNAVTRKFSMAK